MSAVFALLVERPMHGYEIIQELAQRTDGLWKVSSGSIYPTLQKLADKGYVLAEEQDGKRRFTLTESGRELATKLSERRAPWEAVLEGVAPESTRLGQAVEEVASAAMQIRHVGSLEQQVEATSLLDDIRRRLYGILAKD